MRVGTAGWSIPAKVSAQFPQAGSGLERYAQVLSATEINSSFHRSHRRTTYERWAASVPGAFEFSVKLPKTISHIQRLVGAEDLIATFVEEAGGLGDKWAVALVQLPPSLAYDNVVASEFFMKLTTRLPQQVAVVCEPRHATWFSAEAEACLSEQRVARVAADPVLVAGGEQPGGWQALRYHRLHGSPRVYYSAYEKPYLEALAASAKSGAHTWCIFDNTASGAALSDALVLRDLAARPADWRITPSRSGYRR